MQLHELKPNFKTKKPRRVGRGGKKGFTSGRGSKGQRARAGRKFKPIIREIIKRYPKLRGYRFKSIKDNALVLNLDILEKKFESGSLVSPQTLIEKRIIRKIGQRTPKVKILGTGEIKKSLIIENCMISAGAKSKIEKAGGSVK